MTPSPHPTEAQEREATQWRKKPVVIDAVQYTEAVRDAYLFDGGRLPDSVYIPSTTLNPGDRRVWSAEAYIDTLEGRMKVSLDDWIITGVAGEHYACKPDIFAATYERASHAPAAAITEPATQPQGEASRLLELAVKAGAYLNGTNPGAAIVFRPDQLSAFIVLASSNAPASDIQRQVAQEGQQP